MQTYTTKSGERQFKPALDALLEVISGDNSGGFCLACGAEADGVEPDARRHRCGGCDRHKVYGAEELMLMGLHHA